MGHRAVGDVQYVQLKRFVHTGFRVAHVHRSGRLSVGGQR